MDQIAKQFGNKHILKLKSCLILSLFPPENRFWAQASGLYIIRRTQPVFEVFSHITIPN